MPSRLQLAGWGIKSVNGRLIAPDLLLRIYLQTLSEIASHAARLKIPQFDFVMKVHDNKISDIKPPIKRKIAPFIEAIRILKKMDEEVILVSLSHPKISVKSTLRRQNKPPSEMIRKLLDLIKYEDYLRKTQQDWESRWENVQELITFASEVESETHPPNLQPNAPSEVAEQ